MDNVIRCQYRGKIQEGSSDKEFKEAAEKTKMLVSKAVEEKRILTCGMFQYEQLIFLYVEYIGDETFYQPPADLFYAMHEVLMPWPGYKENTDWAYMEPVFWFDVPKSVEQWERQPSPDERCGRIARLLPDRQWGYVTHHLAIVDEGRLVGDRYQFISIHENILFSYYETPRDRGMVNIKRTTEESVEIEKWKAVDPRSHFIHFEEADGADFLTISKVFDV